MDNFQRCKGESVLTHERLMQLIHYDSKTGCFTRLTGAGATRRDSTAGYAAPHGYLRISVDGFIFRAHRLAWFWVHGKWPKEFLDHINNDRTDNRICNLREVGHAENQWNKSLNRNNSVGLKGAHYHSASGKWASHIRCRGKRKRLGLFESAEEAHEVYCLAAVMLHGEFANLGEGEKNDRIEQAA
ncbi:HNH endonuclease [Burkholderia cenocepacia]|uniref:HNH endonuclease n=1 Tax=Burkholderia cenocepacia TaxID=95486 RepID=UPI001F4AAC13|nr:HNH endonuclease [Burkholderia cenocepacia]